MESRGRVSAAAVAADGDITFLLIRTVHIYIIKIWVKSSGGVKGNARGLNLTP